MKFLFKMTFLILVCTSKFAFSLSEKEEKQVMSYFKEIITSGNCNCTKLSLLNNKQLTEAKFALLMEYEFPKSEQELEKIEKNFTELFHDLPDGIKYRMTVIEIKNEQMKCVKKIIETINELKNQKKVE